MNGGVNALGQGNRANLTIGRAVQLVVRNVGGGRPGGVDRGGARQPGQALVLLRRAARLAVRRRSPRAAGRRPAPTPSPCSPARAPAHRRPEVEDPRAWRRRWRHGACGRCTTRSSCSASTPSWWSGPSTGGCSPKPGGWAGRSCCAELGGADADPRCGGGCVAGAGRRNGRRCARIVRRRRRCRSSGPTGSCSPTRAAVPGCSRR